MGGRRNVLGEGSGLLEGFSKPVSEQGERRETVPLFIEVLVILVFVQTRARAPEIRGNFVFVLVPAFVFCVVALVDFLRSEVTEGPALDAVGQASAMGIIVIVIVIVIIIIIVRAFARLARSVGTGRVVGRGIIVIAASARIVIERVVANTAAAAFDLQGRWKQDKLLGIGEFRMHESLLEVIIRPSGVRATQWN